VDVDGRHRSYEDGAADCLALVREWWSDDYERLVIAVVHFR
jgi:hypothetical protein